MENQAILKVRKNPICGDKKDFHSSGGILPDVFILVKEFVDLHCNQVNAIKGIGFTRFNIAKGEE